MDDSHDQARHARRRRTGSFALLLFVVGVAAAPVLDGWLHAAQGTAGAAQDVGDCVVHQLAATQLVVTASAPTIAATPGKDHGESSAEPRTLHRVCGDRLTPPSRAPPA